jgi:hypothetical protein
MTLFQKVRAMLEEKDLQHGIPPEQIVPGAAVSYVLERAYGLDLHGKVNQAVLQAMHGRTNFGPFFRASIANDMSVSKNKELENLRIALMESVVMDVCNGWKPVSLDLLIKDWRSVKFVQLQVIEAYRRAIHDDGSAPTITEVRTEFLEENRKTRLPRGWAFRKMITQTFGLPLSQAKRGRPKK